MKVDLEELKKEKETNFKERLDFTIDLIRKHNVQNLIAMHCTGFNSQAYLRERLKDKFTAGFAGFKISF